MNGIYGYGNGYGYAPPYTPQMGTGAQMPQRCQVIKVNGRNGADAFRMAADSSVLLLDENDPIVWLKTTDGAGYPNDRRSLDDCADNSSCTVHRRKIRSYIRLLLERSNEHDVFGLLHRSQQIQRRHTRILRLHGKGVSV